MRPSSLFVGATDDVGHYGLGRWAAARQHELGGLTPGAGSPRARLLFWAETHEIMPAGLGGVCVFRGLEVHFRCDSPTRLFVLPIVDGDVEGAANVVPGPEQQFGGGPDLQVARVWCAVRGERIAARIVAQSGYAIDAAVHDYWGAFELVDVRALHVPIRIAPASRAAENA